MQFSQIDPISASVPNAGNRFDVPGGAVLYAATEPEGAYAETVARYRPSATMRLLNMDGDSHLMNVGSVPTEWRLNRVLAQLSVNGPLPFLDVEATTTHSWLSEMMASHLAASRIGNLDVSHIRGPDRLLTRAIAYLAYVTLDPSGEPAFSGIRYMSRLGDHECWAIFDGTEVRMKTGIAVGKHDDALLRVARDFGLTVH